MIPIAKNKTVNDLCRQIEHDYSLKFNKTSKPIECQHVYVRECFEMADLSLTVEQCFDDYGEINVEAAVQEAKVTKSTPKKK